MPGHREHDDNPSDASAERLDKWLWAARFFKTRALAVEAINGGKVHVDGQRCKPSRALRPGTRLSIRKGPLAWEIEVLAVTRQRRPAAEAARLYQETDASRARRQDILQTRRDIGAPAAHGRGRPTKRERRALETFAARSSSHGDDADGTG